MIKGDVKQEAGGSSMCLSKCHHASASLVHECVTHKDIKMLCQAIFNNQLVGHPHSVRFHWVFDPIVSTTNFPCESTTELLRYKLADTVARKGQA